MANQKIKYEDFLRRLVDDRVGIWGEITISGVEIENIEKPGQRVLKQLIELRSEVMQKWAEFLKKYNQEFEFAVYRDHVSVILYLPPLSDSVLEDEYIVYRGNKAYRTFSLTIMSLEDNGKIRVYYPPANLNIEL